MTDCIETCLLMVLQLKEIVQGLQYLHSMDVTHGDLRAVSIPWSPQLHTSADCKTVEHSC
jgi:hypothetical protein